MRYVTKPPQEADMEITPAEMTDLGQKITEATAKLKEIVKDRDQLHEKYMLVKDTLARLAMASQIDATFIEPHREGRDGRFVLTAIIKDEDLTRVPLGMASISCENIPHPENHAVEVRITYTTEAEQRRMNRR
jgi:hypothetical protein